MTRHQFTHTVGPLCLLLALLTQVTNCSKEYSYEGGPPAVDTTASGDTTGGGGVDTTGAAAFHLPICPLCTNANVTQLNTWMFTVNGTVACGNITRAVRNAEGTAITFFGPSACSPDTGIIMAAYFFAPGLSVNATNLTADRAAIEYYDNVTPSQIATAAPNGQFSLVIENYDLQTSIATGNFTGQATTATGEVITISAGKFNIKVE